MYQKVINYDRESRDYAMYLDGKFVGLASTYHDAEVVLDAMIFSLLSGEYIGVKSRKEKK